MPRSSTRQRYTARKASVCKEFIAEGINEAGLSAGLFFFPQYGGYEQYDPAQSDRTLADLQLVAWILTQFSTIDQVKAIMTNSAMPRANVPKARAIKLFFINRLFLPTAPHSRYGTFFATFASFGPLRSSTIRRVRSTVF